MLESSEFGIFFSWIWYSPYPKQKPIPIIPMKKFLTIAITMMMAGAAYAGCGVKVPVSGEVKGYDAEKKELTVGDAKIRLAATVTVKNAEGEDAKIEDMVGKEVTVSTDKHNKKGESVTEKKG